MKGKLAKLEETAKESGADPQMAENSLLYETKAQVCVLSLLLGQPVDPDSMSTASLAFLKSLQAIDGTDTSQIKS